MRKIEPPLVYILILNYCSEKDTLGCFLAARAIQYDNYRLLVIDNHSPDGSGTALSKSIERHQFIQLDKNYGYAGGNNKAIRRALDEGADYIFIVNPDVRLPPECLTTYIDIMRAAPDIGALNAVQLQSDGKNIDRSFSRGLLQPKGINAQTIDDIDTPETFESDSLFGAAIMLSADSLKNTGGFDPLFFAYGEEIDLCRRLRMHSYRLMITKRSPVVHLRTKYSAPLSRRILFLKLKGYHLSKIKHPQSSTVNALIKTLTELGNSLMEGGTGRNYPFNTYKYDRLIILRAVAWFIAFGPVIWLHKKRERATGLHYI
jgi:GT2 family glycosyltransferase